MTHTIAPETKSAPADVAAAFEDFSRAFEAFRDTNDTRLDEIETRLGPDILTMRSWCGSKARSTSISAGSTA